MLSRPLAHIPAPRLHPAGNGCCVLTGTDSPRPCTGARVMRMMVAEASASDVTIVPDATTGANSAGAFLAPRAQGRTHSTNQRKRSRRTTLRCPPPHLPQLPCGPCGCRRDRVPHVLACPHARSLSPDQLGPRSASSAHARNANHCPRRRPSCSRTGCSRCAGCVPRAAVHACRRAVGGRGPLWRRGGVRDATPVLHSCVPVAAALHAPVPNGRGEATTHGDNGAV